MFGAGKGCDKIQGRLIIQCETHLYRANDFYTFSVKNKAYFFIGKTNNKRQNKVNIKKKFCFKCKLNGKLKQNELKNYTVLILVLCSSCFCCIYLFFYYFSFYLLNNINLIFIYFCHGLRFYA